MSFDTVLPVPTSAPADTAPESAITAKVVPDPRRPDFIAGHPQSATVFAALD
ncbi:MAG TPA: hypothetical protein PKJ45_11065 [Rubrivivax sp.]|nr:hypothetical protein [Rubrivivax sp.]